MQIILSHVNTDFDALASMIAAKKLYPEAKLVLPDKQEDRVNRFLNIYRDTFDFIRDIHVEWEKVDTIILVDVASLRRVGKIPSDFDHEKVHIVVYDHHPVHENNVPHDDGIIEEVGAAVTLLVEEIKARKLAISEFEATLFGLGLYTDTGNFIYKNTTKRDLDVASYLMDCGMNLELVQRFSEQTLELEQQDLLDALLMSANMYAIDGLEIIVSTHQLEKFQGGLALVTNKLMEIKSGDAALSIVKMKNHIHVVGRASSDRVTLLPLLKSLGGGGHSHAGSALIKNGDEKLVLNNVIEKLETMLKPAITAEEIMSHPVKTLSPDTTIEEAGNLMYRYGHSGYPITENGKLVGLITRRDLDKGNHHGLGHAPVKAYMTTNVKTVHRKTTLEEMQQLIIDHNIGRLPVIENDEIVGIVTRTNIIEILHNELSTFEVNDEGLIGNNYNQLMKEQLPDEVYHLLEQISEAASEMAMPTYLIGGIVRDIILQRENDDIDIVVEGDGIAFAQHLREKYGGEVVVHDGFGTATWTHPTHLMIDITSARLEYYERPASLPDVELSTLEEDLQRRDFTMNAMGLRLNKESFGDLIDPFGGRDDLENKVIKILHNISFVEDPTRIFRAIRFEQRFQFKMDAETEKLAINSMDKVKELTASRIVQEMKRLFKEGNAWSINARLFQLQFWLQFGIAETNLSLSGDAINRLKEMYSKVKGEEQANWFDFFILPFFIDGKIEQAETFALTKRNMKQFDEMNRLFANKSIDSYETIGAAHELLKDFSDASILFLIALKNLKNEQLMIDYLIKRKALQSFFTGEDLMKKGLKPGPLFSKVFLQLEIEQLNGNISTEKEARVWLDIFLKNN